MADAAAGLAIDSIVKAARYVMEARRRQHNLNEDVKELANMMNITYDNVLEPARRRNVGVEESAAWSALAGTINDAKALLRRKSGGKKKKNRGQMVEFTSADTEMVNRLKRQLKDYSQEVREFVDTRIQEIEEEMAQDTGFEVRSRSLTATSSAVSGPAVLDFFHRNPNSAIQDEYSSMTELRDHLSNSGIDGIQLICAIDFTKSNETSGRQSFDGECLHTISDKRQNPYQLVMSLAALCLEPFDDDGLIPLLGFGDLKHKGKSCFMMNGGAPCEGFSGLLKAYAEAVQDPSLKLSSPTNYAPVIRRAIEIVREEQQYHILLLICDGYCDAEQASIKAIEDASEVPLSIVCVGVGDGPWDQMEKFDDRIQGRKFDNFDFVAYNPKVHVDSASLCKDLLKEIPEQYARIKSLGLFDKLFE